MSNKRFSLSVHSSGILVLISMMAICSANAQTSTTTTASAANGSMSAAKPSATPPANPFANLSAQYRIGPGDVLDIRILNRPNLSRESVRVESNGTIRMPLIEGSIPAACLTESELAGAIIDRYLKFYRNPQVDVFIKEYKSAQVAVLGSVNEQGRFLLQRRIRLLELLTFAKGPVPDKAGQTINVIHSATTQCAEKESDDVATGLSTYRLSDTLRGEESSNPFLENGDIVTLPEADQVYVVGNVMLPRTIYLKEPITLTRAIAMSGGLNKDSKNTVRIVRQEPGTAQKKEIYVDLSNIDKKSAPDPTLMPNDIVDVPISGTKSILRSLIGGITPAVSQLPVRVIP